MSDDTPGLTVVKVERENHDTTSLYVSGPDTERFKNRQAGQFATIRVLRDGAWTEAHPFTLSCSPGDDTLRMTIKQAGSFTNTVPEITPGTPVQFAGPFGQFCRGIDEQQDIVMIAGGVGVTPFLSVLRHFLDIKAGNDILLFWANKTPCDAFAAAELEEMTRVLRLQVVHAFSRVAPEDRKPSPAFGDNRPGGIVYEYGRLDEAMLRRHLPPGPTAFYLCGPPPMQQTVLQELAKCGVPAEHVQQEAFVFTPRPPKA